MKSPRSLRLVAALASMAITFTLFSAVVSEAKAPLPSALLVVATVPHAA